MYEIIDNDTKEVLVTMNVFRGKAWKIFDYTRTIFPKRNLQLKYS